MRITKKHVALLVLALGGSASALYAWTFITEERKKPGVAKFEATGEYPVYEKEDGSQTDANGEKHSNSGLVIENSAFKTKNDELASESVGKRAAAAGASPSRSASNGVLADTKPFVTVAVASQLENLCATLEDSAPVMHEMKDEAAINEEMVQSISIKSFHSASMTPPSKSSSSHVGVDNSEIMLEIQTPDIHMINDQDIDQPSTSITQEKGDTILYHPPKPSTGSESGADREAEVAGGSIRHLELSPHSAITANNLELDVAEAVIRQTSFNDMNTAQLISSSDTPALVLQSSENPTSAASHLKQVVETSEVRSVETSLPTIMPTTAHSFPLEETEPEEQSATLATPTDTKILSAPISSGVGDTIDGEVIGINRDKPSNNNIYKPTDVQDNISHTQAVLERASYNLSIDAGETLAATLEPGSSIQVPSTRTAANEGLGVKSDTLEGTTSFQGGLGDSLGDSLVADEIPMAQARIASLNSCELSDLHQTSPTLSDSTEEDAASVSSGSLELSRTQQTETEEMVETEVEETVTMVITGVVSNPGETDEVVVSLQDAMQRGILDMSSGIYHNLTTGESLSMVEAMSTGLIKMGPKRVEAKKETKKSVGIITIRTSRETLPYSVRAAKDTVSGVMLPVEKALRLGLLDPEKGTYLNGRSRERMLIGDAVDRELVEIEYERDSVGTVLEEVSKTYSVHAVIDLLNLNKLPFHEAVERGIIDPDTCEFINTKTGEKIAVEHAISKGLIKATLTDSPADITVSSMGNQNVRRGFDAIRKKVLNPLRALKGFKHSD